MKRLIIAALALLTVASTDPVKDTRQILAGTVTTTATKNAYLSGARDGTVAFKGALSAYKAVRAAEVPVPPPPPPTVTWTHCADQPDICHIAGTAHVRYGIGTSWAPTRTVTGSIGCDNVTWGGDPAVGFFPKECQTDGQVVAPTPAPTPTPTPAPTPTPTPAPVPTGTWVALTVGGYACSKVQAADPRSPCGSGIVYRLTGSMMSADAVPVPMFTAVFFQDASGNFPIGDAYAVNVVTYWQALDLSGIAPAP